MSTPKPMTPEDLAEIEARAKRAPFAIRVNVEEMAEALRAAWDRATRAEEELRQAHEDAIEVIHESMPQYAAPADSYSAVRMAQAHIARAEQQRDELVAALRPFGEHHVMGDNYVQFAPRLIEAARAALKARQ